MGQLPSYTTNTRTQRNNQMSKFTSLALLFFSIFSVGCELEMYTRIECQKMGGTFVESGETSETGKGFCDNPNHSKPQ